MVVEIIKLFGHWTEIPEINNHINKLFKKLYIYLYKGKSKFSNESMMDCL